MQHGECVGGYSESALSKKVPVNVILIKVDRVETHKVKDKKDPQFFNIDHLL